MTLTPTKYGFRRVTKEEGSIGQTCLSEIIVCEGQGTGEKNVNESFVTESFFARLAPVKNSQD